MEPDFRVRILDQRVARDFWGELKDELKARPLLAGISSMTGRQLHYALEISRFIKEHSGTPVAWGGVHATACPVQTMENPWVDFVVKGEGETALKPLLEILGRKSDNFERVPGLFWKRKARLHSTPEAEPFDINAGRLAWHLAPAESYVSPIEYLHKGIHRLLPFEASRGCPFRCTYCSEPMLTRKYRMMEAGRVVDQCFEMVERFKLDHISFYDDEFFVNKKWATHVAEAINGKFTWYAQTRAADLLNIDLSRMEKCGLRILAPGLESGSNRVLKKIKKGETVEEYREANRRLAKTGIRVNYNFMSGFPTETAQERGETASLVLELLRTNKNAAVFSVCPPIPLPATELFKDAVKNHGLVEPQRLEDWIPMILRNPECQPWLDRKGRRDVSFLYYTSHFLCSALRPIQRGRVIRLLRKAYVATVKFRWRLRLFWMNWEIPLLRRWVTSGQ